MLDLRSVSIVGVLEPTDADLRPEDLFRRAALGWALSTKRLVEASAGLGSRTRVAFASLADLKHATEMLEDFVMPTATKVPADFEQLKQVSAEQIRASVAAAADRAFLQSGLRLDDFEVEFETSPVVQPRKTRTRSQKSRRALDLTAPVSPRAGRSRWATVSCPLCGAAPMQRCKRPDEGPLEKPHSQRKILVEDAA